jgi:GMP synthase PP-ATPase subunit
VHHGTIFEIQEFIRLLTGDVRFRLYLTSDGADYAACFDVAYDCIAVWRALRFVPVRGRLLDVRAYGSEMVMRVQPAKDIMVVKPQSSPLDFIPKRKEKEV